MTPAPPTTTRIVPASATAVQSAVARVIRSPKSGPATSSTSAGCRAPTIDTVATLVSLRALKNRIWCRPNSTPPSRLARRKPASSSVRAAGVASTPPHSTGTAIHSRQNEATRPVTLVALMATLLSDHTTTAPAMAARAARRGSVTGRGPGRSRRCDRSAGRRCRRSCSRSSACDRPSPGPCGGTRGRLAVSRMKGDWRIPQSGSPSLAATSITNPVLESCAPADLPPASRHTARGMASDWITVCRSASHSQ